MPTERPEQGDRYADLTNTSLKTRAAAISIASNSLLIVLKLVVAGEKDQA